MVEVSSSDESISAKQKEFFRSFDVVCVSNCVLSEAIRINNICHELDVMFFACDVWGFYALMFSDLNEHEFAEYVTTSFYDLIAAASLRFSPSL